MQEDREEKPFCWEPHSEKVTLRLFSFKPTLGLVVPVVVLSFLSSFLLDDDGTPWGDPVTKNALRSGWIRTTSLSEANNI